MTQKGSAAEMIFYRFFMVNALDGVTSDRVIQCCDDDEARTIAVSLVTKACGVEVWDVGHRVLKLMRNEASAL